MIKETERVSSDECLTDEGFPSALDPCSFGFRVSDFGFSVEAKISRKESNH